MTTTPSRAEIVARADIHAVVHARVPLIRSGPNYSALCPFHAERAPSFTVNPASRDYHCFTCGAKGDVVDFVAAFDKISPDAAIDFLATEFGMKKKKSTKGEKYYDYTNDQGEVIYQVGVNASGKRILRKPDGEAWVYTGTQLTEFPYRLPALLTKPSGTIIIAGSERSCDNLTAAGLLATTNSGGSKKWPDALCQWFAGRNVVILPDNDDPGRAHAALVASKLSQVALSIRIVELPGLPPKGDVSDWLAIATNTPDELRYLCKQAPQWNPAADMGDDSLIPASTTRTDEAPAWADDDLDDADEQKRDAPFRALGFNDGAYFFLPHKTQQVIDIGAGSMTSAGQLMTLAPLEFWEHACPSKSSADWVGCANLAMRWCEQQGTFDHSTVRGRGAWFDAGRSVLHLGNRLLVDRQTMSLHGLPSRFIYQRAPAIEAGDVPPPHPTSESERLGEIIQAMNWTSEIDRMMFGGFVVLAPICGALPWRPHLWLCAQRGAGKSWLLENIVTPLLGAGALIVQGNTSEAGIRQQLRQDARPIIFDEAEGESVQGRARMQHVIELARAASSDSQAQIAKGTTNGNALTYRIRSMFLMASINVGLAQAADKSRFTILSLGKPKSGREGRAQFDELATLVNNTLTDDWCARLRSRTYGLIPVIRANAATFAKAAAEAIGNQRAGDQAGTLLAGWYALHSDDRISHAEAATYVAGIDWTGQTDAADGDGDERSLLFEIIHAQVRMDTHRGTTVVRSIAEILQFLTHGNDADLITDTANDTLARHGMRVKDSKLWLSTSHPEIRRMLQNSPWAGGWGRILGRIDGSEVSASMRFAGVIQRAIGIPLASVFGAD